MVHRRRLFLPFVVLLLTTNPSVVLGDVFGIGHFIGSLFSGFFGGATSEMMGNLRDALIQAEDHLFRVLLPPLISELDTLGGHLISEVDQDVQHTVEHVKDALNQTIWEGVKAAKEIEDHATEDILKVLLQAFEDVSEIEDKFFLDVNDLLDKLSQVLKDIDCSVEGVSSSWLTRIRGLCDDGLIPNPWEKCRSELGLGFTRVTSLDDFNLYKYWKCKQLEHITDKSTQTDILGNLGEGQVISAQFRCMAKMSPSMTDFYTREFVYWGEMYNAWNIDSWNDHSKTI
jgi:hypothetical protein